MKLRVKKSVVVDVQKVRLNELWDKQLRRWDVLYAESVTYNTDGRTAHVTTYDGDVYLFVPIDSFEVVGPTGLEPVTNRL